MLAYGKWKVTMYRSPSNDYREAGRGQVRPSPVFLALGYQVGYERAGM